MTIATGMSELSTVNLEEKLADAGAIASAMAKQIETLYWNGDDTVALLESLCFDLWHNRRIQETRLAEVSRAITALESTIIRGLLKASEASSERAA